MKKLIPILFISSIILSGCGSKKNNTEISQTETNSSSSELTTEINDNLYRERLDGEHAPHGFAARCKCFGQDVVKGRAEGEALFQHGGLTLQLLICHFCVFVIERENRLLKRFNAL